MDKTQKHGRILGGAFLFQAIVPVISGLILSQTLIIPGNITATMVNVAHHPWLVRLNILIEMIETCGIIFLGAVLYTFLRNHNRKIALAALGCYILEAALPAVSRMEAFTLLRVSQEYVAAGASMHLETMGRVTLETMEYSYNALLMLAFSIGGTLFYYLLYTSRIVPCGLSLWGLVTVICPCLIATIFVILGFRVPFLVYMLYGPFEYVIGLWILIKGVRDGSEATHHVQ